MKDLFTGPSLSHLEELFSNCQNPWDAVGSIEKYLISLFENNVIEQNFGKLIYVHPTARVDKKAKIIGPAFIGKNSSIGFAAYVRENSIVLDDSFVGHASSIKNSVLMSGSAAPHNNYIGDSIVGEKVNMGAGSILANWRFDEQDISVSYKGKKYDTGRVKFGAIIGDNTKIGANAVINPGTIVEKNCMVYPLTSVRGYHKEGSIIK